MPPPGSAPVSQLASTQSEPRQVVEPAPTQQPVVPTQFAAPVAVASAQGAAISSRQTTAGFASDQQSPQPYGTAAGQTQAATTPSSASRSTGEPPPASAFEQIQMF